MLKLELVRFSFSGISTYGVMHSRDGWSCYTVESVVLNTVTPPVRAAALGEGLYRVKATEEKSKQWALDIFDVDGEPPVARIFPFTFSRVQRGDIIVSYTANMRGNAGVHSDHAIHDLLHMVRKHDETYLNIRHLDNTQLLHFQRMAREAVQ